MLGLLLVLDVFGFGLLVAELKVVVLEVPLFERGGVNGDHAVLDQSLRADQFVVAGVVDHVHNLGFLGDPFRGPVEVSLVQAQRTELHVPPTDSQRTDSLLAQLRVRWHAAQFELTLLLVDWHPPAGRSSFVSGVSRNSHYFLLIKIYNCCELENKNLNSYCYNNFIYHDFRFSHIEYIF